MTRVDVRHLLAAAGAAGLLVAAGAGWALSPDGGAVLPAGRFLLDACGVAAVGLGMLGWLVAGGQRRDVAAALDAASRIAVVLSGVWAATALLLLWLQAADVVGRPPGEVGAGAVADYVVAFDSGAGLLVTVACAVAYGVVAATSRGRGWPELPTMIALLGLLPAPLTGHAGGPASHDLAVVPVTAHAGAVAVWVGGLGAVLTVVGPRRALLATALPRFSGIAATALVTVAVSGVFLAVVRLGSASGLVTTGYGRAVLVKSAALLLLVVLGAQVRRRVVPAVREHRRAPLVALAGTELAVMVITLGLAAALTRAA